MSNLARLRLRQKDCLNLFTDLSTMLTAGIPILEAVESLEVDSKGTPKKVLKELRTALVNGQPLSKAMETMPQSFDTVTLNLIRAAEAGGTLEQTLQDIVVTTRKEIAFSDSLRTTMIYPAFVMVVFTGIVVLMLTFVIPRIAKVFSTMRVHMPPITRAMIATSNFFVENWIWITIGSIIGLIVISMIVVAHKRAIVRFTLSLPGFRRLGRNIDLSRFTRSFALLLQSGVPLDESLLLSRKIVQNKRMVAAVDLMLTNLQSGKQLSVGLHDAKDVIPPMMSRSIETAERSGTLEVTMKNLSDYFEGQVNERLKVISSLVEPVLLVVVGLLVGTLMITIIAPIYNLISQIKPQ